MQFPVAARADAPGPAGADRPFRAAGRSFTRPDTVAEVDDRLADARQCYIAAYFAGDHGEAQFWVREIIRLENLRPVLERRALPA